MNKISIDEYFDDVQNYVKDNLSYPTQIDSIVNFLKDDNIQAVVNQCYNDDVEIEKCGDKILKSKDLKMEDNIEPNPIVGDRGSNTMERMIIKFKDFINENK